MSQKASPTLIGAFVVGAVALVVIGVLLFGSGAIFTQTFRWVAYFDESVAGLTVGSPVTFRGVRVGQVVEVRAQIDSADLSVQIPVIMEIQPSRFEDIGGVERGPGELGELLFERGLRGQLQMTSIVTGLLGVQLDFHPERPARFVESTLEYPQLPTIPSQIARLARSLEELSLDKLVNDVQAAVAAFTELMKSKELESALVEMNSAMKEARLLAGNLNSRVGPIADGLEDTLSIASEGSPVRHELSQALREMTAAAHSIRVLVEYLERHPDALVRGKRSAGGY